MLSNRDLLEAMNCVSALVACEDHEQFVQTLVHTMHPLLRANVTGYNEADPVRKRFTFVIHPRAQINDERIAVWVQHANENPILAHVLKHPTDYSIHTITDFVDQKVFRKTALCQKLYRPMRGEYQIAMPFPIPGIVGIAIVFNRSRDFTTRERQLLQLLQPIVYAIYRNVQRLTDLSLSQEEPPPSAVDAHPATNGELEKLNLSRRHRQVLARLIEGKSNRQIAQSLKLSVRTVEKFVEQVLKKMRAPNRATAAARYVQIGGLGKPPTGRRS